MSRRGLWTGLVTNCNVWLFKSPYAIGNNDYALTATEAMALGLPVKVGMPLTVMDLMKLYPQPIQSSSVEFLPIDLPRTRRAA